MWFDSIFYVYSFLNENLIVIFFFLLNMDSFIIFIFYFLYILAFFIFSNGSFCSLQFFFCSASYEFSWIYWKKKKGGNVTDIHEWCYENFQRNQAKRIHPTHNEAVNASKKVKLDYRISYLGIRPHICMKEPIAR